MFKNIIHIAFLFIAGVCITACSSGDDNFADNTTPVTPDTQKNIITLTGTINIGSSDISRAVDKEGKVTWTEGDEVYVAYEQKTGTTRSAKGTITDVTGKTATFTATLENPKDEGRIGLAYPYDKVSGHSFLSNFSFTFNTDDLATQAGTPEYITANKLDFASSETDVLMNVPASGGRASIKSNITLLNQVCLCEFSLRIKPISEPVPAEEDWPPLSATKLEIMLGSSPTAAYTITPDHSTDVFYVVMQPHEGAVSLTATYTSATTTNKTILNPPSTLLTAADQGKIIAVDPDDDNQAYLVSKDNLSSTSTLTKDYGSTTKLNKGRFYKQDVNFTTTDYLPVAVVVYAGDPVSGYCDNFIALALEDATSGTVSITTGQPFAVDFASDHSAKISGTTYNYVASRGSNTPYDRVYDNIFDNSNLTGLSADKKYTSKGTDFTNWKVSTNSNCKKSSDNDFTSPILLKGWRIPTVTDWRYVIKFNGGRDADKPKGIGDHNALYPQALTSIDGTPKIHYYQGDVTDFVNGLNTKCGNTNLQVNYYWTGSQLDEGQETAKNQGTKIWRYNFADGAFQWNAGGDDGDNSHIRLVLVY